MGHRANIHYRGINPANGKIMLRLEIQDAKLHGTKVRLRIETKVIVTKDDPVHKTHCNFERTFIVRSDRSHMDFTVDTATISPSAYSGQNIRFECDAVLKPSGNLGLTRSIRMPIMLPRMKRQITRVNPQRIIEPKDRLRVWKNLTALAPDDRIKAAVLLVLSGIVILVNSIIGIHDAMVGPHFAWFYETHGRNSGPLTHSLAASTTLGAGVFISLRKTLKRYMTLHIKVSDGQFRRGVDYRVAALIEGRSRVALDNAIIRIVAANFECGQHLQGSGKSRSRRDFAIPVRAVVLYSKKIPRISANARLSTVLGDDLVRFDALYDALYPDCMPGPAHGLALHWEVQLIHPDLADQEIKGSLSRINASDFYRTETNVAFEPRYEAA